MLWLHFGLWELPCGGIGLLDGGGDVDFRSVYEYGHDVMSKDVLELYVTIRFYDHDVGVGA